MSAAPGRPEQARAAARRLPSGGSAGLRIPSLRAVRILAAVNIPPVIRLVCQFLIVWLALLSSGAHAHATADAVREMGHVAAHAEAAGAETAGMDLDHDATEPCGLGHCGHGHATGLLQGGDLRFSEAGAGAPPPACQARSGREPPANIERPKWVVTTPTVVNL